MVLSGWQSTFDSSVSRHIADIDIAHLADDLSLPHSFESGVEFLLIFDQGDFSESNTGLVSELFLRNPKSVLGKDLRVNTSAFDNLPADELYIFPGTPEGSNELEMGPAGQIPMNGTYSYHFSEQEPYEVPGKV